MCIQGGDESALLDELTALAEEDAAAMLKTLITNEEKRETKRVYANTFTTSSAFGKCPVCLLKHVNTV